jgi:hypothetical protein
MSSIDLWILSRPAAIWLLIISVSSFKALAAPSHSENELRAGSGDRAGVF